MTVIKGRPRTDESMKHMCRITQGISIKVLRDRELCLRMMHCLPAAVVSCNPTIQQRRNNKNLLGPIHHVPSADTNSLSRKSQANVYSKVQENVQDKSLKQNQKPFAHSLLSQHPFSISRVSIPQSKVQWSKRVSKVLLVTPIGAVRLPCMQCSDEPLRRHRGRPGCSGREWCGCRWCQLRQKPG